MTQTSWILNVGMEYDTCRDGIWGECVEDILHMCSHDVCKKYQMLVYTFRVYMSTVYNRYTSDK